MNPTRTLSLAAILIAATPTAAGAGVRWTVDTPHIDTRCDGLNTLSNLTVDIAGVSGDTIHAQWESNPLCGNTEIRFAFHSTASTTWNPDEVQPLLQATGSVLASTGRIEATIPNGAHPACRVQIDLITGDPLIQIDGTHRYNEFAIGGARSRLIAAGYANDPDCDEPTATTETWNPPTTTQVSPPTTITVSNSTPLPPTDVIVDVPLETSTTPQTVLLEQQRRLPETGVDTGALIWSGALTTAVGIFALALSRLRRHAIKEHQ